MRDYILSDQKYMGFGDTRQKVREIGLQGVGFIAGPEEPYVLMITTSCLVHILLINPIDIFRLTVFDLKFWFR